MAQFSKGLTALIFSILLLINILQIKNVCVLASTHSSHGIARLQMVNSFLENEEHSSFEASYEEQSGIDLVAKEKIKKGQLVFTSSPVGATSFLDKTSKMCDSCARYLLESNLEVKCSKNCGMSYCSLECKKSSEPWHIEMECNGFKLLKKYFLEKPVSYFWTEVHEFSRIVVRILVEKYLQETQLKCNIPCSGSFPNMEKQHRERFVGDYNSIHLLCTNEDEYRQHQQHLKHALEVFNAVKIVLPHQVLLSKEDIISLVFSISCNRFGLRCPGDCMGTGMFPLSALINHSCIPNLTRIHFGKVMYFYACRDIDVGSKLLHSYVDLRKGVSDRKAELLTTYLFDCGCERCTLDSQKSNSNLENEVLNSTCQNCGRATVELANGFLAGCVCREKEINLIH